MPSERLDAWKIYKVELIIAQESDNIQGVCFVLPGNFCNPEEELTYVWLFGMVTSPQARNLGALMLFKIMAWYPAIMCMGVTEEAAKLYQALRWKKYDRIWRCVHPICLKDMLEHYKERLKGSPKNTFLKFFGWIYERFFSLIETLFNSVSQIMNYTVSLGILPNLIQPDSDDKKLAEISKYRKIYTVISKNKNLISIEVSKIGRIIRDDFRGINRYIAHFKLWHELRARKNIYCEYIITNEKGKRQAYFYGYIPFQMPIYYFDKSNYLINFFKNIENNNFSYLSCDKLI